MMRPSSRLPAVSLAAGLACSAPTEGVLPSVDGCYRVEMGSWDRVPDDVPPVPLHIGLRTEIGTAVLENGRYLVRELPATPNATYAWSWWEPEGRERLRVVFSTGFTGVELRLRRTVTGAAGTARSFDDHGGDPSTAPVALVSEGCR